MHSEVGKLACIVLDGLDAICREIHRDFGCFVRESRIEVAHIAHVTAKLRPDGCLHSLV